MSKKKMKGRVKWSFCFPLEGGGQKKVLLFFSFV